MVKGMSEGDYKKVKILLDGYGQNRVYIFWGALRAISTRQAEGAANHLFPESISEGVGTIVI